MKKKVTTGACALIFGVSGIAASGGAAAQSASQDMKQQIDALQKQVEALRSDLVRISEQQNATAAQAASASAAVAAAPAHHDFLERKEGDGLTLLTRGGEVTLYGNVDLSVDDTTKGISNKVAPDGSRPAGNNGYLPAVSSNNSYVGLRGFQALGGFPAKFVYQFETQIDVSATSGTGATNSNTSNAVKGGLTSRNTFVGLANPTYGAFKVGKTDAPYKTSTASMNPFSGMLGDYAVIMGNTGGDNRVEFGTRLDHAIWYESPSFHGVSVNALVSPGQNRADDNSNIASGESDCSGGNMPGSGGTPAACNDGSYGTAYSTSVSYRSGPLLLTTAYELHKGVNRSSDLGAFDPNDIANESAAKIGAQYAFSSGTTVSAIYESMRRDVPQSLAFQNERQRTGTWLAVSQAIGQNDNVAFGWAHAGQAPGDPGQHNTTGGAGSPNSANMYTLAWKHQVDKQFSLYADYALTVNGASSHYDLGAGGRGVTTDCHDASNPDTSGFDPNGNGPHCWAGGRLQGASVGMKYTF
ncbi:porin [Oxalobacteraceae bacterium CAVE-383]|nr:porin [Oxalobacteraceae bacterium CAVE-383]